MHTCHLLWSKTCPWLSETSGLQDLTIYNCIQLSPIVTLTSWSEFCQAACHEPEKKSQTKYLQSTASRIAVDRDQCSMQQLLGIWVPTPWPLESFPTQVGDVQGLIPLIWTSRYSRYTMDVVREKELCSCASVEAATEFLGHYECVDLLPGREDIPKSHIHKSACSASMLESNPSSEPWTWHSSRRWFTWTEFNISMKANDASREFPKGKWHNNIVK